MIYKYSHLVKIRTNYANNMRVLSNRIFGEVARKTPIQSLKIVKLMEAEPWHKKDGVVDYYHRMPEVNKLMFKLREYGLYRDEHEDFKEEMERLRTLRGKGRKERTPREKKVTPPES